jgi:hypothetical protein
MLQISEIVKKTEEMFDLFNEHFYHDELTRPAITVSPDGGRGAYGWCSIQATKGMDKLSLITSYAIVANPLAHLPVVS